MIILKSDREIEKISVSCRVVVGALKELKKEIKAGITTEELDKIAEEYILSKGAKPAFKGYRGYPATLCTSINEEVVHGIPSKRRLAEGDIVSLDLGAIHEGYYGDAALTIGVGKISREAERLVKVTEESLYRGIEEAQPGKRLGDISWAIQSHVESAGFSVVFDFVGHGIGKNLHEEPQVPNFGSSGQGPRLKEGMVFAIEPMVNMGGAATRILDDNWTAVTKDGSLSAHSEHTVAITRKGPMILTIF
ncbi:MAG TPA: type I methionyl aminopeptidase [Nitrospiria bacterium]|nr:type I methionyl aminopeptidase [Nitrospiria bacterium]